MLELFPLFHWLFKSVITGVLSSFKERTWGMIHSDLQTYFPVYYSLSHKRKHTFWNVSSTKISISLHVEILCP